ncbi:MAG: DUF167 domain-containing protein [Bryobacteraceae bacterium]|nr:DUF167 domain-containing protein [Bryobacteraceae bacterium]
MILSVKVVPRASRTEDAGLMSDGTRKIRLAAVPENGQANHELRRFLAAQYGVPLAQVEIVSGAASTRKQVRIGGT